jgi:hypothetical protein
MKSYQLINKFLVCCIVVFLTANCGGPKNMLVFSEYEVMCVSTGTEGTSLIKVYAYGKKADMSDAVYEAKRNAVHAILFRGISTGTGCNTKPICQTDALDKHKDFFSEFFKPNGRYLNYVNLSSDGSIAANDRLRVGNRYKVGVIVSVNTKGLRKDLENAGIIARLDSGW